MRQILTPDLWPQPGFGSTSVANAKLRANHLAKGGLIEKMLFYDVAAIPTDDFGIVPALIEWTSLTHLREALENGSIRFLRWGQLLTFVGNGNGVSAATVGKGESSVWPWETEAFHGDIAKALDLQIRHGCPSIPATEHKALFNAVMARSTQFELSAEEFKKNVAEAAYKDVMKDAVLLKNLKKHYREYDKIDLTRFPEVAPNQVRGLADLGSQPVDGPSIVLTVAALNLQIALSSSLLNCDLSTFGSALEILERKIRANQTKEPLI